ncbi:hypothetical protein AVEN_158205-1 [Araneus ventricosus]|uniref:Uncharacterized protein n=1 Tax=Araneus ventricosus TaxID=182803 RepID=A0A4Y2WNA4_ARAVE|nr:hypothetical protein AVEN_158205-1 [Araneus ventricosus]
MSHFPTGQMIRNTQRKQPGHRLTLPPPTVMTGKGNATNVVTLTHPIFSYRMCKWIRENEIQRNVLDNVPLSPTGCNGLKMKCNKCWDAIVSIFPTGCGD